MAEIKADIESELRGIVENLFKEKKIDLFIGYQAGSLPSKARPCFIFDGKDVGKLVFNDRCMNNLAVYLPRFFSVKPKKGEKPVLPKVGIAAKGCDSRSIMGLIKERQVPRENLFIVGIACNGMKEGGDRLAISCLDCSYPAPTLYDVLLGEAAQAKEKPDGFGDVKAFESKSVQERWEYFKKEVSRCIRCYACRQACPNCYCKECFADQTKPKWIGVSSDASDVMVYHLIRAFHQAGRCVDCGACSRACPMGIDVRFLTRKLVKDVKELYGYEAGLSLEEAPPLAAFNLDDPQRFITEPTAQAPLSLMDSASLTMTLSVVERVKGRGQSSTQSLVEDQGQGEGVGFSSDDGGLVG